MSADGRPQWEVEAKIVREKSQGVSRPSHPITVKRLCCINKLSQGCVWVGTTHTHKHTTQTYYDPTLCVHTNTKNSTECVEGEKNGGGLL